MQHHEGTLKGVRNAEIYYQYWLPEGDPKAALLLVHGLAEHCGRYTNVVNHFVPQGYAVYGIDHLGHGKSEGQRVYVDRFSDFTLTLKTYFDQIRSWQPELPVFIVGHSLGGLISAMYLLEHQDELAGAVLSGPGVIVPDTISPVTIALGKTLSVLMPKAGLIQLDASAVSRDPAVVEAYVNDPLVYNGKTTARLGAEMLKSMQQITTQGEAIRLPVMIVQGSEDKLVDPSGAQVLYDLVSSSDKTIQLYDGYYHEVFNDPGYEQVLDDVGAWLEAHLPEA